MTARLPVPEGTNLPPAEERRNTNRRQKMEAAALTLVAQIRAEKGTFVVYLGDDGVPDKRRHTIRPSRPVALDTSESHLIVGTYDADTVALPRVMADLWATVDAFYARARAKK